MKLTPIVAIIALACAGLSPLHGGKAGEAEGITRRPTSEDLARRMASRPNPLADRRGLKPVVAESVQRRQSGERLASLLQRSSMIVYGEYWTLVPKGAVLHVPKGYRDRVGTLPAGTLLPWSEFYARNRGWIFTQPVSIEIARGEKALSEAVAENHQHLGRVVIAVLHRGPISVKTAAAALSDSQSRQNQTRHSEAP